MLRCKSDIQTSCFSQLCGAGAMRQPWQGLEEQWHHCTVNTTAEGSLVTTYGTSYGVTQGGPLLCWMGYVPSWGLSPCQQRASHWHHSKLSCPDRDCAQRQVKGGALPWAPWFDMLGEVCMLSYHPAAPCDTASSQPSILSHCHLPVHRN